MDSTFKGEQERLHEVVEIITNDMKRLEKETTQRRNEVVQIRKHFWDEVKVNTDTFDDYLETIIGLRQEAQALSISQSTHKHAAKRLSTLRRMQNSPYFGRIDFNEDGESAQEQIYIGISSLSDSSGENFLVYDWRAPISSVYYDYEPGSAKYETPGGIITGKLEKKWQYLIRNSRLQSMFDTSLTIGDEILQQVLGKTTDKHMHSIVATIQQDQNKIIRHDQGRLLIVHGAAGSGKTSAALQRIAYLLYKYRDYLDADQIILFSPNTMFSSYVSNVLPELGEENMQQVTFQEYLTHRLGDDFQVENPYEQLEYVLTAEHTPFYQSRLASIQFKASTRFFDSLQLYRQSLEQTGMLFHDIIFREKTLVTAEQITEHFYTHDTTLRFSNRLEQVQHWLLKKINEFQKSEKRKLWVEEEIELLSNEAYHKAHRYLAKKNGFTKENIADYEMEPSALAQLLVGQKLKPLRQQVKSFQFIDIKGLYRQFFHASHNEHWLTENKPAAWSAICEVTLDMLERDKLFYEDATPFLLLQELIHGFQTNSSIKHIVIDEAQDYSPFQFEFLKRLFPAARMTVLGDFNQAIFAHASEKVDFTTLTSLYGQDKTDVINITRSYRSTKPIIEVTRRLIPNGDSIVPFEREGEQPTIKQVKDHSELHHCIISKITSLQALGYQSIAIICKSAAESLHAYEALSHIKELKLIKRNSTEYEQGIVVIPAYLSKGIEFDAVIIYDASTHTYGDKSLRRTFYTACTRAMHHLQLYSIGAPSLFLEKALNEGFLKKEEE
ncbi:RNA polymerase recycling motor HelD [Bacillus sp. CGMCC 1.16541]|uniref:RNA polymerase recycling motor HelD n=1 Tax=Bacillus sp. CGMCC 1.16541 TaxID=2185143 RepID=UPI000D730566|nr:RNA polymerase recycling motor HelD [Bacillus sp. CGMCC 1.16541]